jgi:hypothetical protein
MYRSRTVAVRVAMSETACRNRQDALDETSSEMVSRGAFGGAMGWA